MLKKPCGVLRIDDRLEVSGIAHVIRGGLMWRGAPAVCRSPKTLCSRVVYWIRIWVFNRIFATLAGKR